MSGGSGLSGLAGMGGGPGRGRHRGRHRRHGYGATSMGGAAVGLAVPLVVVLVVCAVIFGVVQVLRSAPAPTVRADETVFTAAGGHLSLPWPTQGSAAIAVAGTGLVGTAGSSSTPQPIASITKLMTALVVIHDHPLGVGEPGPTITITPADAATYQSDVATQQSVVAVTAGEHLTEVQALEAMLVPSGNNMATALAIWDAGSVSAFVAKMNARAAAMGLTRTHFAGPSGLNPASVSTAPDLIRLGEAVMANPVLASMVGMAQVTLPVAGTVYNYDYNLGHNGFIGIKTGSDGQAGGCFLFDAAEPVGGTTVHIIGAVLGQQTPPIIQTAESDATSLVQALQPHLAQRPLVTKGQKVAEVTTAWGASATVVAAQGFTTMTWPGMQVPTDVTVGHLPPSLRRGQQIGTLRLDVGGTTHDIPLVMGANLGGPSIGYKLTNV
ncbi:MAG: D-alanyl-D-alanine carboxypeptidase [Actinomycetota bacterium]|nr:D-alanyl-D-alanine carboxypeptidase [Actinomycetota bacterium]